MKRIIIYCFSIAATFLVLAGCDGNGKNKASKTERSAFGSADKYLVLATENDRYCNARFGFCLDNPRNLVAQPESDNGDGRIYVDSTGNELIRISAIADVDGQGIKSYYEESLKLDQSHFSKLVITGSIQKENYCEVSGEKGILLYFRRTIFKNGIFISVRWINLIQRLFLP